MAEDFHGSWQLQSFGIQPLTGPGRSWGNNLRGLLVYTSSGHVSVAINKDIVPTGNDAKDALDAMLFYAGTYTVEAYTIRHQVTVASNPNRVGKEMIRFAALDGDTLTLTTPQESYGTATLVWKRIR